MPELVAAVTGASQGIGRATAWATGFRGMAFVPEGQHDRSQARSAWVSVPPKEPSRRVRYDRAQLIPEVFLVGRCAVFLKEGYLLVC
jgi:NAD(P)-dependent dehydrogenase (short-subunit alcohol dehydrogenase family)